jgi:hypothetical protein
LSKRVEILIGTKKGAFILESDEARRDWRLRGPFCQNWPTHDFVRAADGTLYAGGGKTGTGRPSGAARTTVRAGRNRAPA